MFGEREGVCAYVRACAQVCVCLSRLQIAGERREDVLAQCVEDYPELSVRCVRVSVNVT